MLAKNVKVSREAKGWDQGKLAKEARVCQQTISKIEMGKTKQPHKIDQIAKALNETPASLYGSDKPTGQQNYPLDLTTEQKTVLGAWSELPKEARSAFITLLRVIRKKR